MNVSRGLFRLWIVASLLWIGIIMVSHWNQLAMIFRGIELAEGQAAVSLPPGDYACWAYHTDNRFAFNVGRSYPWDDDPVIFPQTSEQPATKELKDYPAKDYPGNSSEALNMCVAHKLWIAGLALILPIISFILGYAGIWVVKGFRQ